MGAIGNCFTEGSSVMMVADSTNGTQFSEFIDMIVP